MDASSKDKLKNQLTYADYKKWEIAEGGRFEFIHGEAYTIPSPGERHQAILMELSAQIHCFSRGKPFKVYPAPFDVRLFYKDDESDDTVVQPDITVICDNKKLGSEGCRGVPDLVIEILAPSNTDPEMARKLKLYKEAQVQEYWVVDPAKKKLTAHNFKNGIIKSISYGSNETVSTSILPGLEINLGQVFSG